MEVGNTVADIRCEVSDLSSAARVSEVIVDPSEQDLLWGELEQVIQCLSLLQQKNQTWMMCDVDVTQQTNLQNRSYGFYCCSRKNKKGRIIMSWLRQKRIKASYNILISPDS